MAGGGPYPLQHLAALTDSDPLLAILGHVNGRLDMGQIPASFTELLYHDGDRMRHFLAKMVQRLLPNQFRNHETHRLIGQLIRRIELRP